MVLRQFTWWTISGLLCAQVAVACSVDLHLRRPSRIQLGIGCRTRCLRAETYACTTAPLMISSSVQLSWHAKECWARLGVYSLLPFQWEPGTETEKESKTWGEKTRPKQRKIWGRLRKTEEKDEFRRNLEGRREGGNGVLSGCANVSVWEIQTWS